ncbi:LysR substrate-binding domain-containing protein [Streptomyces sp. NPDC048258]|uniref:LysR substrate-binding domain-containing protein n=1 Tax=Streptomyces sp. NPDC048258 TaxID=3365527 RepID=UPI00371CF1BB
MQLSDPFGPIRRGQVHLQVSEHPVIEPDMVLGPLVLTRRCVLMVPAGHPLGRRASVSLEDLAEATLLPVAGAVPRYWLDHHYPRQTPLGRPRPARPGQFLLDGTAEPHRHRQGRLPGERVRGALLRAPRHRLGPFQ